MNSLDKNLKTLDLWYELSKEHPDNDFYSIVCKVENILHKLKYQPCIFPINFDAIQLEYEIGRQYLEFTIKLNETKLFYYNEDELVSTIISEDDIYNIVKAFHEKSETNFVEHIKGY